MLKHERWIGALGSLLLFAAAVTVFWLAAPGEMSATTKPADAPARAELETANPLRPLPQPPLGIQGNLGELDPAPTPESVRLGRWLFFDPRLSTDQTVSCATCHRAPHGFSEPTPVSTGVGGKQGNRKAPPVLNMAFNIEPHQFWDGRAATLEEQAIGPMVNPVEMAMPDHDVVVERIRTAGDYGPFFTETFGDDEITIERIGKAIADYERTRFSGNSAWDRWQANPDAEDAAIDVDAVTDMEGNVRLEEIEFKDGKYVSAQVKLGHYVFFEKAFCNQCHLGPTLSDSQFHNLGVGWDPEKKAFADEGRSVVTKKKKDRGAFKTPTLREVSLRAPYMHDGSIATLREVVELYVRGGERNPWLSPKVTEIDLTDKEIDALVAFLESLEGEGFLDRPPTAFPGASVEIAQAAASATCGCMGGGSGGCSRGTASMGKKGCCRSGKGAGGCPHRGGGQGRGAAAR